MFSSSCTYQLFQEVDEQFITPVASASHSGGLDAASLNINKFLLETPDNQTQTSRNRSSGSKSGNKKREVIDLDDLPDVDNGTVAKKPLLANVKIEKDD